MAQVVFHRAVCREKVPRGVRVASAKEPSCVLIRRSALNIHPWFLIRLFSRTSSATPKRPMAHKSTFDYAVFVSIGWLALDLTCTQRQSKVDLPTPKRPAARSVSAVNCVRWGVLSEVLVQVWAFNCAYSSTGIVCSDSKTSEAKSPVPFASLC